MPRSRTAPAPWSPRFDAPRGFDDLRAASARLGVFERFPSVPELDAALAPLLPRRADETRYRLVPQAPRPRRGQGDPSARYDVVIDRDGVIPTRDANWHDLFNALVWASFPLAKRGLSARQRRLHERADAAPAERPAPTRRSRTQDALALLDEGGALVLHAEGDTVEVLHALDEGRLDALLARGVAKVVLFGHALFEHFVHEECPRASLHPLAVPSLTMAPDALRAAADRCLATALDDDTRFAAPTPHRALHVGVDGLTPRRGS